MPLTLAGYRLNFGSAYHVRVADPVEEVRLVGYPSPLVMRDGNPQAVVKHGVQYHYIPIRVAPVGFWEKVKHPGAYPGQLEVEVTLPDHRRVTATLPIVLQLSFTWKLVLLLAAWALLSSLWGLAEGAVLKRNLEVFYSPWPWVWGFLLAILYPALMVGRRFLELRRRAAELRRQFRLRWSLAEVQVAAKPRTGESGVTSTPGTADEP